MSAAEVVGDERIVCEAEADEPGGGAVPPIGAWVASRGGCLLRMFDATCRRKSQPGTENEQQRDERGNREQPKGEGVAMPPCEYPGDQEGTEKRSDLVKCLIDAE